MGEWTGDLVSRKEVTVIGMVTLMARVLDQWGKDGTGCAQLRMPCEHWTPSGE